MIISSSRANGKKFAPKNSHIGDVWRGQVLHDGLNLAGWADKDHFWTFQDRGDRFSSMAAPSRWRLS
jgi:hypothetical protein